MERPTRQVNRHLQIWLLLFTCYASPVTGQSAAGERISLHANTPNYEPGATVTLSMALDYESPVTALGLELDLPEDWSFASSNATAQINPSPGQENRLEWAWFSNFAPSPTEFEVVLNTPLSAGESVAFTARGIVREPLRSLTSPTLTLMRGSSASTTEQESIELSVSGNEDTPTSSATVRIAVTYQGDISAMGIEVDIPAGWHFVSSTSNAQVRPRADQTERLEWAWFSDFPTSGATFDIELRRDGPAEPLSKIVARAHLREPARTVESSPVSLAPTTPSMVPLGFKCIGLLLEPDNAYTLILNPVGDHMLSPADVSALQVYWSSDLETWIPLESGTFEIQGHDLLMSVVPPNEGDLGFFRVIRKQSP